MRQYIDSPILIDGRNIPYPVSIACEYFAEHDGVSDVNAFVEKNYEIYELVTQILALKQSCFLLRHTSHSCQSLSDGLLKLKFRLIKELKEQYDYDFDDEWMEQLVPIIL